jgi:DNA uptake protein ComE-like DNA-binding protein
MRYAATTILFLNILFTGAVSAQVGKNQNLVYADIADKAGMLSLPHMTEGLAQAIIDARPITSPSQLDKLLSASLNASQRTELYGRLFRPLNLNTASRDEMMLIPGLTDKLAHEFEEYRPYTSMEQFRKEIGKYVDAKEVARLEQYVFAPMNLNTASEDAFKTIPGMSNRMVHEFEEYRPYTSMEQFRKEIGKYVDVKEVARLESYVTLK